MHSIFVLVLNLECEHASYKPEEVQLSNPAAACTNEHANCFLTKLGQREASLLQANTGETEIRQRRRPEVVE